jgi:hypothetical protein
MKDEKRKLKIEPFLKDIESGVEADHLMLKYDLTPRQFRSLLEKLIRKGRLLPDRAAYLDGKNQRNTKHDGSDDEWSVDEMSDSGVLKVLEEFRIKVDGSRKSMSAGIDSASHGGGENHDPTLFKEYMEAGDTLEHMLECMLGGANEKEVECDSFELLSDSAVSNVFVELAESSRKLKGSS